MRVEIDHSATTYRLVEGEELTIRHVAEELTLVAATRAVSRPTPPAEIEPEPEFEPRNAVPADECTRFNDDVG